MGECFHTQLFSNHSEWPKRKTKAKYKTCTDMVKDQEEKRMLYKEEMLVLSFIVFYGFSLFFSLGPPSDWEEATK